MVYAWRRSGSGGGGGGGGGLVLAFWAERGREDDAGEGCVLDGVPGGGFVGAVRLCGDAVFAFVVEGAGEVAHDLGFAGCEVRWAGVVLAGAEE